jgi:hypothetical protein
MGAADAQPRRLRLQASGEACGGEAGEAAAPLKAQDLEARGAKRDSGREREAGHGKARDSERPREDRPGTDDKERDQLMRELSDLTHNLTMTDAMK